MLALLASALLCAAPAPAPVPMPGDAVAAKFKTLFEKGELQYQQAKTPDDFGAAIWNFKQADRQRVTPEVAYDLAKCHEKLSDVAYTIYYYRLYMKRAPKAPDTLDIAEKVGTALAKAELDGRGFLELDVPRADAVTVNKRRTPESPVAMFLPPGDYEITAEFPAGPKTMQVSIMAGRTATVSFEPVQPPVVTVEKALSADALARGADREEGPKVSGLRIGSFVTIGLGVGALATGIAFGVMSMNDAAKARDKALTVRDARGYAQSADTKAIAANFLYGGSGVLAGAAVLMFVFSMPLPEPGIKGKSP